jgi:ATP-dependent Clp protease ATP-binding subunit ClpC
MRSIPLNNLTPRAQRVLEHTRKEADRLNRHYIGAEHLALSMIGLGESIAVNVLQRLGLDPKKLRSEVQKRVVAGDQKILGNVPFTPGAKQVIALAVEEANRFGHPYVGTEHVLLGLLQEGEGIPAMTLKDLGVDIDHARHEVATLSRSR